VLCVFSNKGFGVGGIYWGS